MDSLRSLIYCTKNENEQVELGASSQKSEQSSAEEEEDEIVKEDEMAGSSQTPATSTLLLDPQKVIRRLEDIFHGKGMKGSVVSETKRSVEDKRDPRRVKLSYEWRDVRHRWKRRTYDFSNETDVGGVIAHVTRQELALIKASELEPKEPLSEQGDAEEEVGNDEAMLDEAARKGEAVDDVLGRLKELSQDPVDQNEDNDEDVDWRPFEERLDYHTLGYSAPRKVDLDFDYSRYLPSLPTAMVNTKNLNSGETTCTVLKPSYLPSSARLSPRCGSLRLTPSSEQLQLEDCFASLVARQVLSLQMEDDWRDWWRLENRREVAEFYRRLSRQDVSACFLGFNWRNRQEAWKRLQYELNQPVGCVTERAGFRLRMRVIERNLAEQSTKPSWTRPSTYLDNDCTWSGVTPPIAERPLDISGIPELPSSHRTVEQEDRRHRFAHRWTLAILLVRYFAACEPDDDINIENNPYDDIEELHDQRKLHEQKELESFSGELVNQRSLLRKYVMMQTCYPGFRELPLAGLHRAVSSYYSLAATGCLVAGNCGDSSRLAEQVVDGLSTIVDHNGLQFFPDTHLTFGLFQIARALPDSAASMVGTAPLGKDGQNRTPIDVFRQVLLHLEENELLLSELPLVTEDTDGVRAAEVEYAIFQGMQSFSKCVDRDPTNCIYQAWYLGAQLACLVICSGNRIGSGAHSLPSTLTTVTAHQRMYGEDDETAHEIRPKLPKFDEHRENVVGTLRLVLQLHEHRPSKESRDVLISVLEWNQGLALVLGGRNEDEIHEACESICRAHAALSVEQQVKVYNYGGTDTLARADRLAVLMRRVERDPSDIVRWRQLVVALGPLACSFPSHVRKRCVDCADCRYCALGRTMDHGLQAFVQSFAARWETDILWSANEQQYPFLAFQHLVTSLKRQLKEAKNFCPEEDVYDYFTTEKCSLAALFSWMGNVVEQENHSETSSKSPHDQDLGGLLPSSKYENKDGDSSDEESIANENELAGPLSKGHCFVWPWTWLHDATQDEEYRAYSVYLLCHVLGPSHPRVISSVLSLIHDSVGKSVKVGKACLSSKSGSFKCLSWLKGAGLWVVKYLQLRIAVEEGCFGTVEQRQAIDLTIEERGYMQASFGAANFPSLKKLGPSNVRVSDSAITRYFTQSHS